MFNAPIMFAANLTAQNSLRMSGGFYSRPVRMKNVEEIWIDVYKVDNVLAYIACLKMEGEIVELSPVASELDARNAIKRFIKKGHGDA